VPHQERRCLDLSAEPVGCGDDVPDVRREGRLGEVAAALEDEGAIDSALRRKELVA